MATPEYTRIIYPERAEYLNDHKFEGYKVFLDHWDSLAGQLKSNFEEAVLRGVSKTLLIFGAQSSGKTLLGKKIASDFKDTDKALGSTADITYDSNNIWHRIVSGFGNKSELIKTNTSNAALLHIEDDIDWIEKAKAFCSSNNNRTPVIIADNCERDYFIQSLSGLKDEQFLSVGRTDALIKKAAQRYVALCRTELRRALVVMFTNDEVFALSFEDAVNSQHKGLVVTADIPIPGPRDKETVVRVNTNRLNPFTYWYCLDRAGVDEKKSVFRVLQAKTGFKEAFEAVDAAIQKASPSRIGRPPKKCLLTLFLMSDLPDVTGILGGLSLGDFDRNVVVNSHIDIVTYKDGWAGNFELGGVRQQNLIQSEWAFRIILAGNQFVSALLSGSLRNEIKTLITLGLRYHGPGTHQSTLDNYRVYFDQALKPIAEHTRQDLTDFWGAGGVRSADYERELKAIFPDYNTGSDGFLNYRPDIVIEAYKVCALSESKSEEDIIINEAIRRNAIACEFTASKVPTVEAIKLYLDRKLKNYVEVLQEQ